MLQFLNWKIILLIIVIVLVVIYYFRKNVSESYESLNNGISIINFNTSWCGYSKQFQPVWDIFTERMQGKNVKILDVKCDDPKNENICENLQIPGYPTIILFKNGEQYQFQGERNLEELEKFVNKHL